MLRRLLARLQAAILERPRRVLAASALLVALAAALGMGVEFRTSRAELVPRDDPDQARYQKLVGELAGSDTIIACVEAVPGKPADPKSLRKFADALAAALRGDRLVGAVFHRVDLDWFLEHGLYLASPSLLDRVAGGLEAERDLLDALPGMRDIADFNDLVARRLEDGMTGPGMPEAAQAAEGARGIARLVAMERRFLEDPSIVPEPDGLVPLLAVLAPTEPLVANRGYVGTRDGRTLFVIITARGNNDTLEARRDLVGRIRGVARGVEAKIPGFRVALTGEPARVVEEMSAVRRDTWFTSLVAIIGVTLLTVLVFRWKTHALLVLVALAAAVVWAFGAVRLELGYLNLITSAFVSTLVGVGVAYGIHPVSEYEMEGAHTVDTVAAIREAYHRTGVAVTVSAVTTAAAFFSILLMNFRGFAELGLVAGVGVLLCLAAALEVLPALLAVYGRRRARRDRAARTGAASAAVDRLWVSRGAGLVCRMPRTASLLALAVTVVAGALALGVRFNSNVLDLLPKNAESLRYQRKLLMESDLAPDYAIVVGEDLAGLRALRKRAAAEPAIERFESVLSFLPTDAKASEAAVRRVGELLDDVRLPESLRAPERKRLAQSLVRLESALAGASEAAFTAGLGNTAAALEEARAEAEAAGRIARVAPAEAAWAEGQERLLALTRAGLAAARRAARADPPTVATLPPELRKRLVTSSGKLLGLLHPKGSVFDPEVLEPFVEATKRVSSEATGFPVIFRKMSHRITSGFYRAAVAGAVLVFLILLADYRNLRETLLAMVPLVIGVLWMLGGMRLFGLSFNFANLVAVPLILGVGIDNGVHVVHRLRFEGKGGMTVVLRHTGRAILIASLTTMIGFGSLALASHRGLASLGMTLLLGVGACLITSTIVLPNLLVAFGLARR